MTTRRQFIPIISFLTAECLSLVGNQIVAVALPILVLQYTHSALVTGIASIGNVLPVILAAFFGGRAIDRFGARHVSIVADLLSSLSTLALPLACLYFYRPSPLVLFSLVLLGALFDPTGIAARQTLIPTLSEMSGTTLDKINSWRGSLENGADFLGPVIGAALIGWIGTVPTFFINATSFVVCALLFSLIIPTRRVAAAKPNEGGIWRGTQFILRHPQLKSLAIIGLMTGFVILPFLGLLLPVLTVRKFQSSTLLGICLSVFGIAATIGAAAYAWLAKRLTLSAIYYGGGLLTGSAIMLCALATRSYQMIGAAGLAGLLLGAGNPLQQTVLQEETPKAIAGQVFTSLTAVQYLGGPLGLFAAGIITEYLTIELALLMMGAWLVLSAFFGWFVLPLRSSREPTG